MVERILVDTDVLIDYVKGRVELPEGAWYISEITLYEFIRGTRNPEEAKRLLEEEFIVLFHSNEVLEKAAEIWRVLRKRGELIDDRDLLIGALAITMNLPLLTRNKKHFQRLLEFGLKFYQ